MDDQKKENIFAKEAQAEKLGISPVEEMSRNQAVHLITLQSEKEMVTSDAAHVQIQVDRMTARRDVIAGMAECECKAASIVLIDQRIQKLEEAIVATQFTAFSEMVLNALEQLEERNAKTQLVGIGQIGQEEN